MVPPELSLYLYEMYKLRGVRIIAGAKPARLEGEAGVQRMVLENGRPLEASLVVMGVGVRPNTELARAAGLALDERGALLVDEFLRTSDPHIYAAGDIAAWPDPTFGRRLRVEHWDVARAQGLRAGRNMVGEGKPYQTLPYFYFDLFELNFEAWGDLTTWDAAVLRGGLESGFALYCFAAGSLTGVLAVGRPDAERKPMQALVRARAAQAALVGRLQDKSIELGALAHSLASA